MSTNTDNARGETELENETPATDVSAGEAQGQNGLTLEFLGAIHDALAVAFTSGCSCGGKTNPNWRTGHAENCSAGYYGPLIERVEALHDKLFLSTQRDGSPASGVSSENPAPRPLREGEWTTQIEEDLAVLRAPGNRQWYFEEKELYRLQSICLAVNASLADSKREDLGLPGATS